jgi:hypothetical protein
VDAKGAALPHDSIEKERSGLGNLIIFDKEFLKLVDDQEGSRRVSGILCRR